MLDFKNVLPRFLRLDVSKKLESGISSLRGAARSRSGPSCGSRAPPTASSARRRCSSSSRKSPPKHSSRWVEARVDLGHTVQIAKIIVLKVFVQNSFFQFCPSKFVFRFIFIVCQF